MFVTESLMVHCIYWFCTGYILLKVLNYFMSLIYVYIVPCYGKHNFKKYGKWAVITGCTEGTGKGFAEELAGHGMDICLISRNEEKLQNTAKQLENQYCIKTTYIVADFTDPNVYDHIEENLDDLDIGILVNNVGIITDLEPFSRHDRQLVRDIINVNILSTAMVTSIIAPKMVAKKCGLIINMSSLVAQVLFPYLTVYSASKSFMNAFGRGLSEELKPHNVQVTTLTPGCIRTNLAVKFPIIDRWLNYLPKLVAEVKEYVKSGLIVANSGHFLVCGYLAHEFYGSIIEAIPVSLRTLIIKFSMNVMKKMKNN